MWSTNFDTEIAFVVLNDIFEDGKPVVKSFYLPE